MRKDPPSLALSTTSWEGKPEAAGGNRKCQMSFLCAKHGTTIKPRGLRKGFVDLFVYRMSPTLKVVLFKFKEEQVGTEFRSPNLLPVTLTWLL